MAKDEPKDKVEEVASAEVERPPVKQLSGVRYRGYSDVRTLSVQDLQNLGAVDVKGPLTWSKDNGKVVSISDMNASTVDALIKLPEFDAV